MSEFTPELGQWGWSNTPWQELDSPDWMLQGLEDIAVQIAQKRGHEPDEFGIEQLLISNWGEEPFVNDVFAMRTYCWCDGATDGHEDGCPPNFEHTASGLVVNWYKHAGRGRSQNRMTTREEWRVIVASCLESI